ncbi:MAG TPA: hypothetical protein VL995_11110 [Cellvibrio sp.]|nr:hypothetical protein [Cellvibrio sp.]
MSEILSTIPKVDTAIKAAKEKYVTPNDTQLAAWISSQGGMW